MEGMKCDRCGQEIKGDESWERDVHDKPFDPYESEYAFNKYGGNARHVGECPISLYCPCKCSREAHENRSCWHKCVPYHKWQRENQSIQQPNANPTDLELLVIDLGDSCVVRVEKGEFTLAIAHTFSDDKSTMLSGHTFPELRKAIEGDKPVPRIIRDNEGYLLVEDANTNEFLAKDTYDALSQLAGKPLPIHSNGTWEQLVTTNGVTIWKFTR